jgi:hypothetical protein
MTSPGPEERAARGQELLSRWVKRWASWAALYVVGAAAATLIGFPIFSLTGHTPDSIAAVVSMPFAIFFAGPVAWYTYLGIRQQDNVVVVESAESSTLEAMRQTGEEKRWYSLGLVIRAIVLWFAVALVIAAFVDSLIGLEWAVPSTLGWALGLSTAVFVVRDRWVPKLRFNFSARSHALLFVRAYATVFLIFLTSLGLTIAPAERRA